MKYKHVLSLLVALNLSSSFASASVTSGSAAAVGVEVAEPLVAPKTLNASTLHEAYQDFLSYFHANPEKMEPAVLPEILFAQELRERDEELLSLQMLNGSAFDVSSLSPKEISVIHDCIRWTYYKELVAFQEDASTKPWLLELIYQVFPNHAAFQAALKLAASDDLVVRRQGALDLYGVMTDTTDVVVRRRAAVLCMNVRDADYKSFLEDAQLEVANSTLMDAVADSATDIDDKLFFAEGVFYKSNANNDKKQVILNYFFSFLQELSMTPEQKIASAIMVIDFGFFQGDLHRYVHFMPESQRYAALELACQVIAENPHNLVYFPILSARKDSSAEYPYAAGEHLAIPKQRGIIMESLKKCMQEGREYQRLKAARYFLCAIDYPDLSTSEHEEIIREASKECSNFLDSSSLTYIEKMLVAWRVMDTQHFDVGKYVPIETKRLAITRLIELTKLPDFEQENKISGFSKILGLKETDGKLLANPEQISWVATQSVSLLASSVRNNYELLCLVSSLLESYSDLTNDQFRTVLPGVLHAINSRQDLAGSLLNHKFATPEQRAQVVGVFVTGMNNEARELESRKNDARFIAGCEYATAEQKAAAAVVLGLS
jgi:hypothetical protein